MAALLPLILPSLIQAGGSILGSYLSKSGNQETDIQKSQRELIDELLASLSGEGKYSDLFNTSEEDFTKRFVEPAKRKFQNEISPAIQQQFISSGQQRSSGLEDTLTRAGVNLDDLLNQQYLQYQQAGQGNQMDIISRILGQGPGAPPQLTTAQTLGQGISGYLASPSADTGIDAILKGIEGKTKRKGFAETAET